MAQVTFDENTGVVIPSTREVREDLAQAVQDAMPAAANGDPVNVDSSSPLGQIIDLATAEVEAKNSEVGFLANQFNPDVAYGVFLDALANLYGLQRKVSEPTVVVCTCTGLRGTVIPYGAIVEDSNGNQLRHIVVAGATIGDDGTVDTTFATVEHGPIEIGASTVTKIVTVIAGWDTVTNAAAGATGRDIEPDGELRNRMKESYAMNANGTVANIQANLAQLDGVLDCIVLENFTNLPQTQYELQLEPHSIAVCIVGGEDAEIARVLFERKSGGCGTNGDTEVTHIDTEHFNASYTYKIVRPTAVDFSVKVEFFDDDMNVDAQAAVKEAITKDFLGELENSRVTLASTVYASRFYQCVQSVTTAPIKSITVGLDDGALGASVDVPADESPTISDDTITLAFGG
jgi:uncharacterized phage protein gp47/JayE